MKLPWRLVPVGTTLIETSLTESEGDKLAELATGARVLEIGSAYGYSAVRMATTARCVISVDPHQALRSEVAMSVNLLRCDTRGVVTMMVAGSEKALPALRALGAHFDLIFIDGDHEEQAVERDVSLALPLMSDASTLACHDYGEDTCPGVQAALDRLYPGGPMQLTDTLWIR